MALTQEDLRQIRGVMDDSIAEHPRIDKLEKDLVEEIQVQINFAKDEIVADVCEVMQVGLTLIGERFEGVERRLDNLKIVSNI